MPLYDCRKHNIPKNQVHNSGGSERFRVFEGKEAISTEIRMCPTRLKNTKLLQNQWIEAVMAVALGDGILAGL